MEEKEVLRDERGILARYLQRISYSYLFRAPRS
jgi:hypothetical protein